MSANEIVGNAIGAVVALKVLDSGMKIVDSNRKKIKKINLDNSIFSNSKNIKKWY